MSLMPWSVVATVYGGAILSNDVQLPLTTAPETQGLTYIVKADNMEAARKFFEEDPYYKAGAVRVEPAK